MITLDNGLKNSLIVLEHLRNNEDLNDITIDIGAFTNCRECGLTFMLRYPNSFTWCVYEHRNSDDIIINGKEGYISKNGDIPYMEGTKWDYIASFNYHQHYECAKKLAELIIDYSKNRRGN